MKFRGVEWPRWWYFPFLGMGGLLLIGTLTVAVVWTGGTVSDAEKARLPIERDREPGLEQLDEAIRLNPDYTTAYIKRAKIRLVKRDFDGALLDVEVGMRESPTNQELMRLRAEIRSARAKSEAGSSVEGATTQGGK